MATGGWCGLGPLLFRKKAYGLENMKSSSYVFSKTYTKKPKLSKVARSKKSSRCKDNFVQMMELRKRIVILRDIIDLPPLERSASINELVVGTMEDLQKLYPEIISDIQYSEMKTTCIEQSLAYFCTALKSIGESWMQNHEWRDKSKFNLSSDQENASFNEIVQSVLATIDCIVSMANERFDMMEEYVNSKGSSYSRTSSFGKNSNSPDSCSETNSSCCSSPETPTSVLANFRNSQRKSSEKKSSVKENVSCSSPLLWSLRVQAVEKLNPIDIKHLLLPRLSHYGIKVCPAPNAVAVVEELMVDVDDKLTSKETDVAYGNEEMEASVTKVEKVSSRAASRKVLSRAASRKVLSRAASRKADTNEEMEVSVTKDEKVLSRAASRQVLSRAASRKADTNEEMEVSVTKDEKVLSRVTSQKTDRNEEMVVSDIKEEKLNLSKTSSQKADINEEMVVNNIKEEKLNLSRTSSQKTNRNEEMIVNDIKEEKLNLSRTSSQKTNRNEEMVVNDIIEEKLNLSRISSQKADRNEEMVVNDIKEEKLNLSRTSSQKEDKNEEMEVNDIKEEKLIKEGKEMVVNDIKEEKLNLSRTSSQKNIAERTNDIDSQAAAIVEELLPAPELPNVASKPSPPLPPVLTPPPPPPPCTPQPSVVAVQLPTPPAFTPPPPPPPMIQQTAVLAQQLSQPPPPPPLPETSALPAAAAPMTPPLPPPPSKVIETEKTAAVPPTPPTSNVAGTMVRAAGPPPPPPPSNVTETTVRAAGPPPPPPSNVTETTVRAAGPPPPRAAGPPPPPPSNVTGTTVRAAGPPPPPPMTPSNGAPALAPPPPMPQGNGLAAPPPPPGGALRSLRAKKSATKLKRSHQLGNLYRTLKVKVEGSHQNLKGASGKKGGGANSNGGKQGMADALAEMTKRSAYFIQIQEDIVQHAKAITELKGTITNFQSSEMSDLVIFHKKIESVMEKLTDESQVLASFEGFPVKKLETIRIAAALYSKLDAIVNQLENWKIVSPLAQLLDKIEVYFSKIKGEVDALDRTKDDEAKRFKSHGIQFDFIILIRIKESMVDVSSSCMELAMKEKRELKAATENIPSTVKIQNAKKAASKMLWRAFQFAYGVYTFAGGHDDRADMLTRELALEIESDSQRL